MKAGNLPLGSFYVFVETHKLPIIFRHLRFSFSFLVTCGTVTSKHALASLQNAYFISLILYGSQRENIFKNILYLLCS